MPPPRFAIGRAGLPVLAGVVGLLLTLLQAAPATGQTIRGVVLDAADDTPIATAQVNLLNRSENQLQTVVTDADGRFSFDLEHTGRYRLRASRIGYTEVMTGAFDVLDGEVLQVEVRISTRPIELPPLTVIAERPPLVLDPWLERGGYYEREARHGRAGLGQFLGVEEVDQLGTGGSIRGLFRMIPGLRPEYDRGGRDMFITDRRGRLVCYFVDGRPVIDPADLVIPSMIIAIEIYARGVIPWGDFDVDKCIRNPDLPYRPFGAVVAIWTGFREP